MRSIAEQRVIYVLAGRRGWARRLTLRFTHAHAAAIGYAHDKANRMTTMAGLSQGYDAAGNQSRAYSVNRGTSYTCRYDHHNRLTGVYDAGNTTRFAAFNYDALGRRVEWIDDEGSSTARYAFDGVNELAFYDGGGSRARYWLHGVSYVDERLLMYRDEDSRPYYYVIDRLYDVWAMVDRAGALVERYAYDGYGRPYIRESCGRGDLDSDSLMTATDLSRLNDIWNAMTLWDPRADLDDDGVLVR